MFLKRIIGCITVEYPSSGFSVTHEQELTTFSSTQNGASLDSDHPSSSGSHSATDTPPMHAGVTINSSEGPSQNTSALVQSNNSGQSGLSMFQGYWVLSFLLLLQYFLQDNFARYSILHDKWIAKCTGC
jgi:hypothetical protein